MTIFVAKLSKTLAQALNSKIYKRQAGVVKQVREFTKEFITGTPTYRALIDGDLKAHFGFPAGTEQERVDPVLDVLVNNIYSRFSGFTASGRGDMRGNWRLSLNNKAYDEMAELPGSVIENTGFYGGTIEWLRWMVEQGDEIIIVDFRIKFGNFSDKAYSRSGEAIMIPKGSWAVPAEYSGTPKDNWFTRALANPSYKAYIKILTKKLVE